MRRSSNLPKDPNQRAAEIVRLSTEEPSETSKSPVSEYLAKIGAKGGIKGGPARAAKLSGKRRKAIARKAAKARWSNKNATS